MPEYEKSHHIGINGRIVELKIQAESLGDLRLRENTQALIKWEISQRPENINNRLAQAYLEGNIIEVLDSITASLIQIFNTILRKYIQFISERFYITLDYNNKISGAVAAYDPVQSDIGTPYFVISPQNLIVELLRFPSRDMLYQSVLHEFVHHLDREKLVQGILIRNRIYHHVHDPGANIYLVSCEFLMLRDEGVASFIQHLDSDRTINCFMRHFSKLFVIRMKEVCETVEIRTLEVLHDQIMRDRTPHNLGVVMVAIIVISNLFRNDKKFSVWIRTKGLIPKDFNASRIKEFYEKEAFNLIFSDIEADRLVIPTLEHLRSISHIRFLKEYEEACKQLKLIPFINLKSYNYFKRKCWENYKRFMDSRSSKS